ncbi:hypothetical protein, partial [Faecalibacterium sp. An192]|uniref:hypothetical protein n=1 Tax=Faecalibacterium sp. An192 TaxID=1965581 RepID=UPI0019D0DD1F
HPPIEEVPPRLRRRPPWGLAPGWNFLREKTLFLSREPWYTIKTKRLPAMGRGAALGNKEKLRERRMK